MIEDDPAGQQFITAAQLDSFALHKSEMAQWQERLFNQIITPPTDKQLREMDSAFFHAGRQSGKRMVQQQMMQRLQHIPQPMSIEYIPDSMLFRPVRITEKEESLLAKILRLYHASMVGDVRSPLVHLIGPPGCGKSTSVEQAAEILGVNLFTINVSRMSPLDIEGVQMPTDQNTKLLMLTATWWTQLNEGDIVLFDEFLRGFPEVYNGLLDILTSRMVGAYKIPKVFFIAASNSAVTYDKALEDRLLHMPVVDARNNTLQRKLLAKLLIEATGMLASMKDTYQMEDLLKEEVLPMYNMLDQFKGKANVSAASIKGHSIRHLIGQVRLRQIESGPLKSLIEINNRTAMSESAYQFVILPNGKNPDLNYVARARKLQGNPRLTEIQAQNLDLNLQLIEMEEAIREIDKTEEEPDDQPF